MKPESRNSIPAPLAYIQRWMESERLLHKLLPIDKDASLSVLRIRRNFKFRKLIVESGNERFICYTHLLPRGLRNMQAFTLSANDLGLSVPQPIQSSLEWSDFLRQKCFSLVLPYLPGTAIGSHCTHQQLTDLGSTLGKLHSLRGIQWGPLMTNFQVRGHYWAGLQAYWDKAHQQLSRFGDFAHTHDIDEVIQWLKKHGQFLEDFQDFSLIHGDPASGNFLIQPDGTLSLIDCDRISYEPGPMELANALLQAYCQNQTEHRLVLTNAYLSICPEDLRLSWEAHAQFYIAAALLWRGQRKLQWSIKRHTAGQSSERAEKAWKQLLHVIKTPATHWSSAVALLED